MAAENRKVAFVVNPIAGMGGKVSLKGTDGVAEEAVRRGAVPISSQRAAAFLARLKALAPAGLGWHTAAGAMGEDALAEAGFKATVAYAPKGGATTAEDTKAACAAFVAGGCGLVIFVGGDGTARDVHVAVNNRVPILGVPSGVKMHSGVFAVNPEAAAELVVDWLAGKAGVQEGELLDLDEERYRKGEWNMAHFGYALTPFEPSYLQAGKEMFEAADDREIREGIASQVAELMEREPEALWILGPGSTLMSIGEKLGVDKTLLGVDCVVGGKLVAKDATERQILELMDMHPKSKVVVSPIGSQGFFFGRGNLQISSAVVKRLTFADIVVVATPAKLSRTPDLRVDFDDPGLVDRFNTKKYIQVVIGYHASAFRRMG
jgi:predicted polyphosphate/ATP-dependent NAD kinase